MIGFCITCSVLCVSCWEDRPSLNRITVQCGGGTHLPTGPAWSAGLQTRAPFLGAETCLTLTPSESFRPFSTRWSGTGCVLLRCSPPYQIQGQQGLSQTALWLSNQTSSKLGPSLGLLCCPSSQAGPPAPPAELFVPRPNSSCSGTSSPHRPVHPSSGRHTATPTRAHSARSREATGRSGSLWLLSSPAT